MEDKRASILVFYPVLDFSRAAIVKMKDSLFLRQHNDTEDLLKEHAAHLPARKRTTSGEPEHCVLKDAAARSVQPRISGTDQEQTEKPWWCVVVVNNQA